MNHRSWPLLATGLAISGLLSCLDAVDEGPCEEACRTARRCGLLPSALGGSRSRSQFDNEGDCVTRCRASDDNAVQVEGLLRVLRDSAYSSADDARKDSLCRTTGVDLCEELIEELDGRADTSELSVTAELSIRMTSALSHATSFSAESWCCFDFDFDFYETPDDANGDGTNEIAAVHDMFQPTFNCLERMLTQLEEADSVLTTQNVMPDDPVPCEVSDACKAVSDIWPKQRSDAESSECRFAEMSPEFEILDIRGQMEECSADSIRSLFSSLSALRRDWSLETGGVLIDDAGTVREAAMIQSTIQAEIRDEIARPMGFLENACDEFFDELGEDGCETLERGGILDAEDCSGGPLCNDADCLDPRSECNRALCDADISPPNRDCTFFGITSIRLGYRTDKGVETYGDPIDGCADQNEVVSTFEGVKVGSITPLAVISGSLGPTITPEGDTVGDGNYVWFIEGTTRWVSAGTTELTLPSPRLEYATNLYENPLEYLEWMPRRFPLGQACDIQPEQCEGFFNDNCEDGIDNDEDGVGDGASPWCNELLGELVDRCVVSQPGRNEPPNCAYNPGDPFSEVPDSEDLPDPDTGGEANTSEPSGADGPEDTVMPEDTCTAGGTTGGTTDGTGMPPATGPTGMMGGTGMSSTG